MQRADSKPKSWVVPLARVAMGMDFESFLYVVEGLSPVFSASSISAS
jgi:hypothetical protein